MAWRFISHLTRRETIEYLCTDLPAHRADEGRENGDVESAQQDFLEDASNEQAPLLESPRRNLADSFYDETPHSSANTDQTDFSATFANLNALEIASVADAKKFLSQKSVQNILDGIWKGDIIFWDTLTPHATKQAKVYRKTNMDPYCRLRVPLYLKMFEVLFFAALLAFYYVVLVQKQTHHVTVPEAMLYVWLVSFTYNELVEFRDAGSVFYATDFWSLWDLGIICVGIAFFIARMIGLAKNDAYVTDIAFDILAVESLFLVPR